jgi:hypothetical protein
MVHLKDNLEFADLGQAPLIAARTTNDVVGLR